MKKSLIALVALATVATAAQSQSSVTVYGVMDAGVRQDNHGGAAGNQTSLASGVLNTSRFGFRGTEDLGAGLKANFTLESGLAPATGASSGTEGTLFDRRSVVGLEGGFGRVDLGRNTTFTYDLSAAYVSDPLGNEFANQKTSIAEKTTAVNPVNLITGSSAFASVRRDNAIKYAVKIQNVTVGLMYGIGGQAGDSNKNESFNGSLRYTSHGVDLGVAYDVLADTEKDRQKVLTIGGNYTISGVKTTIGYHSIKQDQNFLATKSILNQTAQVTGDMLYKYMQGATASTANLKMATWNLGLGYNFTPALNVVGAYYNTKYSADGLSSQSYDTYIVRTKYALSKRTDLYAAVDYTKSKDLVAADTVATAKNATGVSAGVQHRF